MKKKTNWEILKETWQLMEAIFLAALVVVLVIFVVFIPMAFLIKLNGIGFKILAGAWFFLITFIILFLINKYP